MKSKKVLNVLGITRQTLSRYVNEGKIRVTKLDNGFYDYNETDVLNIERESVVHDNEVVVFLNGSKFEYNFSDENIKLAKKILDAIQ